MQSRKGWGPHVPALAIGSGKGQFDRLQVSSSGHGGYWYLRGWQRHTAGRVLDTQADYRTLSFVVVFRQLWVSSHVGIPEESQLIMSAESRSLWTVEDEINVPIALSAFKDNVSLWMNEWMNEWRTWIGGSSHGHHGSKRRELAQHAHSRGSHAYLNADAWI